MNLANPLENPSNSYQNIYGGFCFGGFGLWCCFRFKPCLGETCGVCGSANLVSTVVDLTFGGDRSVGLLWYPQTAVFYLVRRFASPQKRVQTRSKRVLAATTGRNGASATTSGAAIAHTYLTRTRCCVYLLAATIGRMRVCAPHAWCFPGAHLPCSKYGVPPCAGYLQHLSLCGAKPSRKHKGSACTLRFCALCAIKGLLERAQGPIGEVRLVEPSSKWEQ